MIYHGIILGGNLVLAGGRNIASFRLRTAAKKHGYDVLALDSSVSMKQEELEKLLDTVITKETLMIGVSKIWLNGYEVKNNVEWVNDSFFQNIKNKFPHVTIVTGGSEGNWILGSDLIYRNSDWIINGYSDISFPKLLDLLNGKKDHGLIYTKGSGGKKIVRSNSFHIVTNPDDIETVLESEDAFLPHQPIPLEVSRGCIFRCSFCNHPFQGAKDYDSYIRSVDSLANELKRNYELFGTTRYSLMDDTFNDSIEKLERLARAIEKSKIPSFEFMSYIKPELLVTKPEMIPMLKNLGFASGFAGIESLQNTARKSIKKGMDIDRVMDAIAELRSVTGGSMYASFIVGLPGDSKDDIYKSSEFLKKNTDQYITAWGFQALGIYYDRKLEGFTEIDRNPEKFGYRIISKRPDSFAKWENDFMSSNEANNLAKHINDQDKKYMKISGWMLPLSWHIGLNESDIKTVNLKEFDPWVRGTMANRQLAENLLKRFNIRCLK
jgi:radical SAM superfamily enzyme YgiQ (UPF0313 family)